ncbi:hypothetical protein [Spiroplasma endosymbiont of Virgichneumon dumeticola]
MSFNHGLIFSLLVTIFTTSACDKSTGNWQVCLVLPLIWIATVTV